MSPGSASSKPLHDVPGPAPSFLMGNALDFMKGKNPWEVCADYADRFGPVTKISLPGRKALVLNDADLIGSVLDSDWTQYYKDAPCAALRPVITSGSLFISNYKHGWTSAREENPLSMEGFDEWLARQIEPMTRTLIEGIARLATKSDDGVVDLYWETQRLTFDAFARAFWGREFGEDQFQRFRTLARTGDRRMKVPLPLPPMSPWFYAARRKWYSGFQSLVAETRLNPDPGATDLLNVTLCRGTTLSDAQIAEALATNFFGGVFSGSSSINTVLYLLARHPEVRDQLVAALDSVGNGLDTVEGLLTCEKLDHVLREGMRYYPAVPLYFRNSSRTESVALGDNTVPPNTLLFISNWWLHKFSDHWKEPQQFEPNRWQNGVAEENPFGSGHFFPFGRGPRACIGQPFVLLYLKLALSILLRRTTVDLDPDQQYKQSFFFGVMMPKGLVAQFRAPTE